MIDQIKLISAICSELDKQGMKSMVPRQWDAVIAAANSIIAECNRPPVMATPNMGLATWLTCDDVGLSSKYMASILSGWFTTEYAHPIDADDFGRCVRLLQAAPWLRDNLTEMRSRSKQWENILNCWDKAEGAILANNYEEANRLITEAVSGE